MVGTDDFEIMEVVDGQQRLTTLILLFKAIAQNLDLTHKEEKAQKDELDRLLVKGDDINLPLLQTNHDKSAYFIDYLRKGKVPDLSKATSLADHALANAINRCEGFVAQWAKSGKSLLALSRLLKNRLEFTFHEVGDEALVYTVFEVLNSRGLEVAWLDRTKSALMAIAFEDKKTKNKTQSNKASRLWSQMLLKVQHPLSNLQNQHQW